MATESHPFKHYREGMSLVQLMDLFSTEEARARIGSQTSDGTKTGRYCPRVDQQRRRPASANSPFGAPTANNGFSVRTGDRS